MKTLRKCLSVVVCVCMVALCSCSEQEGAVSFKNAGKVENSIDASFMYFWISLQKSLYVGVAEQYEDGWEHVIDKESGTTVNTLLMTEAKESAKNLVIAEYLHDTEYKLKVTDEQKDTIDAQWDSLVSQMGSESNLESALSKYGASKNTLKRYYTLMVKQTNLYTHLYGENGGYAPSEQEKQDYFVKNYGIADHIFFKYPVNDENGNELSKEKALEMSEQKIREAYGVYETIVNAGGDFDELKKMYNEDAQGDAVYPSGFCVTNNGAFPAEFTSKVLELKAGQTAVVETPGVGVHIVRKHEMNPKMYSSYEDVYNSITQALCEADFKARLEKYASGVVFDESVLSSYNPSLILAFAF